MGAGEQGLCFVTSLECVRDHFADSLLNLDRDEPNLKLRDVAGIEFGLPGRTMKPLVDLNLPR